MCPLIRLRAAARIAAVNFYPPPATVTNIKAYAEILKEIFEEKGDEQSAMLMQKLDLQVDRLTSLISALLDTTRITEGKLQLEKTGFEIDELIMDTVETLQRIAGEQRIELDLKAQVTIHADRERKPAGRYAGQSSRRGWLPGKTL